MSLHVNNVRTISLSSGLFGSTVSAGILRKGFISSAFSPKDIPRLLAWYDTSIASSVISDGARQFTIANSEYFQLTTPGAFSPGDTDFTFAGWFYIDDINTGIIQTAAGVWDTASQQVWTLRLAITPANTWQFTVSNDGTNVTNVSWSSTAIADVWFYIICWHDSVGNTINIKVSNGTTVSTAHTTGLFAGTDPFRIGANSTSTPAQFFGGKADSVAFWSRTLTTAEMTWLHDGGNGRVYADIGIADNDGSNLTTNLVSWYNMSEPSGNAIDAHGSNDLTDTNTVTASDGVAEGQASDGDVVFLWSDQSGNENLIVQNTVSAKPVFKATGGPNSLPSILFDGVNDRLGPLPYSNSQPCVRFLVFKAIAWGSNDWVYSGNTALKADMIQTDIGVSPDLGINSGTTTAVNDDLPIGTYGIAIAIFNGASSSLQINNMTATTGNVGSGDPDGLTLAAQTAGSYSNVQMCEFLDYEGLLSSDRITLVKNYLATKWGITL